MHIEDKDFKIGLLKEFWNKRDRSLVPPSEKGMGIKKQKFLFFYNLMARSLGENYTLSRVKAFEQGPVYYDIYAYVKQTGRYLEQETIKEQEYSRNIINATLRLVESESSKSISDITHALDLWKVNYDKHFDEEQLKENILFDENNVNEEDITSKDNNIIKTLYRYYSNLYENYVLENIDGKICAIEKVNKQSILEVLNKDTPPIKMAMQELLKIDITPKINYNENFKNEELEGVTIDI